MNDGKLLETLVATVEELLLPQGFQVRTNKCIFNDEGVQIAEFDIEIEGKAGTTDLRWLIECRDRPSQGAAPNSWIEQLAGRKDRFRLSKVIAVSSTGFAKGAEEFAREKGIELRTVFDAKPSDVSSWLGLHEMTLYKKTGNLVEARITIGDNESVEVQRSLKRKLKRIKKPFLRSLETNELVTIGQAFQYAIRSKANIYDDLMPDGGSKNVIINAQYPSDDNHFTIETKHGDIRVRSIIFVGQIILRKEIWPVSVLQEYRNVSAEEVISSKAGFQFEVNGLSLELALHNINQSGETHILMQTKHKEKRT
ncbi:MAG: restriction endonuclease [Pseudohongiellaceae bacterium]